MLLGAPVGRALAAWAFDAGGTARRVQHALKYGGRPALGVRLGRLVGGIAQSDEYPVDAVVPVPLSGARLLERGYNQAEMLARGAAPRPRGPGADAPGPLAADPDAGIALEDGPPAERSRAPSRWTGRASSRAPGSCSWTT